MGGYISASEDTTTARLRELEARLSRLETFGGVEPRAPIAPQKRKTTLPSRPAGAHGALMKELMERRRASIDPVEEH